jgi:hypothetical protein
VQKRLLARFKDKNPVPLDSVRLQRPSARMHACLRSHPTPCFSLVTQLDEVLMETNATLVRHAADMVRTARVPCSQWQVPL